MRRRYARRARGTLQVARGAVKRKPAALAQLIVVRLHAEHDPALTGRDIAAELADVGRAGAADILDRGGDAFPEARLRRRIGGKPDQRQRWNGNQACLKIEVMASSRLRVSS